MSEPAAPDQYPSEAPVSTRYHFMKLRYADLQRRHDFAQHHPYKFLALRFYHLYIKRDRKV